MKKTKLRAPGLYLGNASPGRACDICGEPAVDRRSGRKELTENRMASERELMRSGRWPPWRKFSSYDVSCFFCQEHSDLEEKRHKDLIDKANEELQERRTTGGTSTGVFLSPEIYGALSAIANKRGVALEEHLHETIILVLRAGIVAMEVKGESTDETSSG